MNGETQRETILLVEDEPAVRQLFSQALMRAGYRVHELLAQHKALKLLCISGYPGGGDLEFSEDFLAKPFSRDEMLKKVREVLDRS